MPDIWWYGGRKQWVAEVKDPRSKKRVRWYLGPDEREARQCLSCGRQLEWPDPQGT